MSQKLQKWGFQMLVYGGGVWMEVGCSFPLVRTPTFPISRCIIWNLKKIFFLWLLSANSKHVHSKPSPHLKFATVSPKSPLPSCGVLDNASPSVNETKVPAPITTKEMDSIQGNSFGVLPSIFGVVQPQETADDNTTQLDVAALAVSYIGRVWLNTGRNPWLKLKKKVQPLVFSQRS